MTTDDLAFDQRHIWHPYTSMTSPLPVYPVASAEGCELILSDGRRLVDGMSSWWAAIHGYNHPQLNAAMKSQIDAMSHVMFGGITHAPAIELCRKLVAMTPQPLECVFLADSGSVAVEVAMKMALQYWPGQRRSAPAFSNLPQWLSWRYLWRDVGVRSGQLNAQPVERLSARKPVCSRPAKPHGWRMG